MLSYIVKHWSWSHVWIPAQTFASDTKSIQKLCSDQVTCSVAVNLSEARITNWSRQTLIFFSCLVYGNKGLFFTNILAEWKSITMSNSVNKFAQMKPIKEKRNRFILKSSIGTLQTQMAIQASFYIQCFNVYIIQSIHH